MDVSEARVTRKIIVAMARPIATMVLMDRYPVSFADAFTDYAATTVRPEADLTRLDGVNEAGAFLQAD